MHPSSMLRMEWFRDNFLLSSSQDTPRLILDVGSQCVPGQSDSYKVLFDDPKFKYIGMDMTIGYNVDIVVNNAYQWNEIEDNFCDVLISGQVFEHVEFPWFTIT